MVGSAMVCPPSGGSISTVYGLIALLLNHGVNPSPVPADQAISLTTHFRTVGIYRIIGAAAFFLLDFHNSLLPLCKSIASF
jgi:hypothetical protein